MRRDELAADLMETYGVSLEDAAAGERSPEFVAALALQLPPDCRWRVAEDRDAWWTGDRMLAASLVNSLNGLVWGMSDKRRRGPRPRPVGPTWAVGGSRKAATVAMDREALMRELRKPRRRGEMRCRRAAAR